MCSNMCKILVQVETMLRKKSITAIASAIAILIISADLFAGEKIDSERIQTYKGVQGRWVLSRDFKNLKNYMTNYGASYSTVVRLNGKDFRDSNAVFIPYSGRYLRYLRKKGIDSEVSNKNEAFLWPVRKFDRITSAFGDRRRGFHVGIDIPAGTGTPIVAMEDGVVTLSKFLKNYGKAVFLEHRGNYSSRYCHASELLVKEGDLVKKGQVIAYVGSTGRSTGPHLHLEIRCCGVPLNPLDFLPFDTRVKKSQYMKEVAKK